MYNKYQKLDGQLMTKRRTDIALITAGIVVLIVGFAAVAFIVAHPVT